MPRTQYVIPYSQLSLKEYFKRVFQIRLLRYKLIDHGINCSMVIL